LPSAWQDSDSESISGAWEDLKDVIVNAADKNWFVEECEQVINQKNQA
jgi:hypothetical protein